MSDEHVNPENKFQFYLQREGWTLYHVVGHCPGIKLNCPKCYSDKISIFFKPGFIGRKQTPWCNLIDDGNFSLCNDYEIIKKSNYHPNWNCKNCYDGGVILKGGYGKLLEKFHKFKKNFTVNSEPVMFDANFNKVSMKEIHDISSDTNDSVSMIAVTRHQYHVYHFSKYVYYIKNMLGIDTIYYGLWTGGNRIEYDVLYVIPTDDYVKIQKHLNSHNFLNDNATQEMALVISNDGSTKIIRNESKLS